MMPPGSRIYVAGHRGMVGSAIVRALGARGHDALILASRQELDLTDAGAVDRFFRETKPEFVFLAAAKVGGILANVTLPVDFLDINIRIAVNVLGAAHRNGVRKLLNLGSSCIYPRLAPQPLREESLLTGPLEPTNEAYAIAKIAAIKLCDAYRSQHGADYISAMPCNLYGPNDSFDLQTSHVLPALMRKCHEARRAGDDEVVVWGSGQPRREFLHVDDVADAACFLMDNVSQPGFLNVGSGTDVSIRELAGVVAETVGYRGRFTYDAGKPDGTPRKVMDVSKLAALGWRARLPLDEGIRSTYRWYVEHVERGMNATSQ
jgi:GDP-L-fucose synthase